MIVSAIAQIEAVIYVFLPRLLRIAIAVSIVSALRIFGSRSCSSAFRILCGFMNICSMETNIIYI